MTGKNLIVIVFKHFQASGTGVLPCGTEALPGGRKVLPPGTNVVLAASSVEVRKVTGKKILFHHSI